MITNKLEEVTTTQPPVVESNLQKFPTITVNLPSKGLVYPDGHPLRTGVIEMKYMTTKEEDILSTPTFLQDGTVLDRLFQSMIITKFDYNDLLLGDRNAIMIWARILGYGPEYKTKLITPAGREKEIDIDLSMVKNKVIQDELYTNGNKFLFTLPTANVSIEFKLLTVGMQKDIDLSISKQKTFDKIESSNLTTRLRYMIESVNGNTDKSFINSFIPNILAKDSRALREYISQIQPDVDLTVQEVDETTNKPFQTTFQLGLDLFWPDYKS